MKFVKFENDDEMPIIGLGTWKSQPGEVYDAILWALKTGYRHIDCASIYDNEAEIGEALQKAFDDGIVTREEMFITSKLWNNSHRQDDVIPALQKSLKDLKLDYLDLYLIHWPIAHKKDKINISESSDFLTKKEVPLLKTWEGMEDALNEGLTNHIGVSNFNITNLAEILDNAEFPPEINQIELHPLLPQNDLVDFCHENGVQVTAYAPLGSHTPNQNNRPNLLENDVVKKIATKHNATPAQVLLAWGISRNTVVIPKSVNRERIKENFDSIHLELDEMDIEKLTNLEGPYRFVDGTLWTIEGSPYDLEDLW